MEDIQETLLDSISDGESTETTYFPKCNSAWGNAKGVTLSWSDLSVYVKSKENKFLSLTNSFTYRRIVNNVSGAILPGTLVAMMGPSGAGKSTIMKALGRRYADGLLVDGDIRVNGRMVDDSICHTSGFMYQEDIFVGALTVKEHLTIMAHLKMDRRLSNSKKYERVSQLIIQLGLSSCENSKIGGLAIDSEKIVISGGEQKRLSFATECLNDPALMFCDEPTTGLDSYSAQRIVSMMREMTENDSMKTILCTIHQPSPELLHMFHNVILVAEGAIIFSGPAESAIEFFKMQGYLMGDQCSPGEFLINTLAPTPGSEAATQDAVKRLAHQFELSEHAKATHLVIKYSQQVAKDVDYSGTYTIKPPLWTTKFYWLWYRFSVEMIRNPNVQWMKIFQKIIIAVMVGFCYLGTIELTQSGLQAVQGVLFILVTENTFAPMYAALSHFPQEFPLFLKEYKNATYSPCLYYITTIVAKFPGLVFEALIFSSCVYWMSGLQDTFYAYGMAMLITVLCINVSAACGTLFSTAFESASIAMAYLVPFDYVVMITSGLFIKLSSLPSYSAWIKYLSWFMYSYESLTITQWDNIHNISCIENRPYLPCMDSGDKVLERFSFSADNLQRDIIAMIGLYLTFHILGFLLFVRRIKTQT